MRGEYGDEFVQVLWDVWNILIDRAEAEAYDKIKTVPNGKEWWRTESCTAGSRMCRDSVWRSRRGC